MRFIEITFVFVLVSSSWHKGKLKAGSTLHVISMFSLILENAKFKKSLQQYFPQTFSTNLRNIVWAETRQ